MPARMYIMFRLRTFSAPRAQASNFRSRPPYSFSTSARKMGNKQEWMVILPDKKGALEQRMKVRPTHLANVKPHVDGGLVVMGGASLDEPIKEGEAMKINGSVMMAEADTEAEVWALIKKDVYYTEGVWDPEKIQVFPFKSAFRVGL